MEQQLRLADRRGVFQRPLSGPAEFGLMLLDMWDNRNKEETKLHSIKVALLGADPTKLPDLFPEYLEPEEIEAGTAAADQALASGDAVEDWSDFTFTSPSSSESEYDEMMRLQEQLLANSQVKVSQDEGGKWF